jgi:NADH dehydrogenase
VPHVVIVGGGFGGLNAARALRRAPVQVTLVDRRNHHVFQPLLYQVATASLSPSDIASPIRYVLRAQRNVQVLLSEARNIDLARRTVTLDAGEIAYDYLIVAGGARHSYFGHQEWETHAPGLKTLDDALEMRRKILLAFEEAERERDRSLQQRLLTFVIIGGGPTGVELAGALAEIARHTLAHDFRSIDPSRARIILLEAGASILPTFPEKLRAAAHKSLERLGVEVRVNALVTNVQQYMVTVGDESIVARVILWAAGVSASKLGAMLGVPLDRAGRVIVQPDLSIPGHPEVFVVGDLAACLDERGWPLPGVAQVAIQQGRHAAHNVERHVAGRPLESFKYSDYGNMATIGRASAVGDLGWVWLSGWIGWVVWLFIHVMQLIGFRNRVLVMFQWAVSYLTYQRSARLITGRQSAD